MKDTLFTDYVNYRTAERGFDRETIEAIPRYSPERYYDTERGGRVAVGPHERSLVMTPFEETPTTFIPFTVHASIRQRIRFRMATGRFAYE